MRYLGEFRKNLRPLSAAAIGVSFGMMTMAYISSIFSPYLIQDFGWSRSQFAQLGYTAFASIIVSPLFGRLADMFGIRRVAPVAVAGLPLIFFLLSFQTGDFRQYFAAMLGVICLGSAGSVVVYTRLIAERFVNARGLALTIVASGPAVLGALGVPALKDFIDEHGWRAGFQMLAAVYFVMGVFALLLLPRSATAEQRSERRRATSEDYVAILRTPAFWLIVIGMFLWNLPATLHTSQMTLMLLDTNQTLEYAAQLISIYAISTIIGRLTCGVLLDMLPTHLVAGISLGLPAIGLAILSAQLDGPMLVAAAIALMGVSYSAEGDLLGYLVARYFPVGIYSTVLGIVAGALGAAAGVGAIILSATLRATDSFSLFTAITAAGVLISGVLFLALGAARVVNPRHNEQAPASE